MSNELYSLRAGSSPSEFTVIKLDRDLNPSAMYALNAKVCTCPAGTRSTCKHRKMLPFFLSAGHVDDGWFLEWDTRLWRGPPRQGQDDNMTMLPGAVEIVDEPLLGRPPAATHHGSEEEEELATSGASPQAMAETPAKPSPPEGEYRVATSHSQPVFRLGDSPTTAPVKRRKL